MKKISYYVILLVCCLPNASSQISGPSEVSVSITATYVNSDAGSPGYDYEWEVEDAIISSSCEDSVQCSWSSEGFYIVRLKRICNSTYEEIVLDSLEVVVGDPPFIEYSYDNAGNRIKRDLIYYSERKAGLKNFEVDPKILKQEQEKGIIKLYPNPAQHTINIILNKEVLEAKNARILIFDMQGKLIRDHRPINYNTEVNIAGLPMGTYIVKLQYGARIKEWMLIKQ